MKKIFNYILVLAAAGFVFASCQKEVEDVYVPGQADLAENYGVYFPTQDASGDHIFNPTQDPVLEIKVCRNKEKTKGELTVPVKAVFSEEGIFEAEDIKFADGQEETSFKVRFDKAVEGKNYSAKLLIDDPKYASLYGSDPIGIDFSIMRVEMITLKDETGAANAKVIFTVQNNFLGDFGKEEESWEIPGTIQYYEVDGVRYGSVVPDEGGIWFSDAVINFVWYPKEKYEYGDFVYQPVEVPLDYTGYELDGSEVGEDHPCAVTFSDYYHYYHDVRGQIADVTYLDFVKDYGANYKLSYYDGQGGFYFNLVYAIEGTSYWYGFCDASVVGIAQGYTRVDYRFKVSSDYSSEGYSPISLETGTDIASIKYAIYEGELTSTQAANKAEAIIGGNEASVKFSDLVLDEAKGVKYATLLLEPKTSGLYTFVAAAYDKDNKAQAIGSVSFNHVAAADVEEKQVVLSVFTEPTPARYVNYHDYDSFAYGVAGKDLTDVHIQVYKYDDFAKNPDATISALKADAKGAYAVSEDVLAQINGEGGYYNVASGLPAKTDFIVVAWATNGDMEDVQAALFTTEPAPYVWKSIGKGTLTDGFIMTLFGMDDVTVECDVYEESVTPGLYMVTGFQLDLCAAFYEMDAADLAPYEGENWFNAEIVVEASDPAAVHIGEQDYGIYVNSSYGYVLIDSDPVGTLANGVITFPEKKMYVGLSNVGWYYGNSKGTFAITLPQSGASAPALAPRATSNTPKNFVLSAEAQGWEKPVVKFERDPKPVEVAAKVSYIRSEKAPVTRSIDNKPFVR